MPTCYNIATKQWEGLYLNDFSEFSNFR